MRFSILLSIASVSFTSAAAIKDDALTDLYSKAEQFQKLITTTIAEKSRFSKDDYAKVWPNLQKDDNIKDLIVNKKVSFSLKGLSIPEEDANRAIVGAVSYTKAWFGNWLRSYVAKKTDPANIEETKTQFRAVIAELSKNEKLKESVVEKMEWVFTKHPEFASFVRYAIASMPEVFDKEVLDYAKLFLTEVHTANPEMVGKLWMLTEWAQTKYTLLPEAQYNNLKAVFVSFK